MLIAFRSHALISKKAVFSLNTFSSNFSSPFSFFTLKNVNSGGTINLLYGREGLE